MKLKLSFKALLIISVFCNSVCQAQNQWNLNSSHDYPTFVDVQFNDNGRAIGEDNATSYIQNISNSTISFSVEFTINDYCGNSKTIIWPGGLNLKSGERKSWPWSLTANCKELLDDGGKKFGIKSVYCKIFQFKNLTEEANKYKEEQLKKEKLLADEKAKKEKIAAAALDKLNKEKEHLKNEENIKIAEELKRKKEIEEKEIQNQADEKQQNLDSSKAEAQKKVVEKKTPTKIETKTEEQKQFENESIQRGIRAAQEFESQGDRLSVSNPSAAKENYDRAQSLHYTPRVAEKIKGLKSSFIAKGAVDTVMGVDELASQIDPDGNTRHSQIFSGFDGVSGVYDNLYSKYKQDPYNINFFGIRMSAIFLALELRMGYNNSPVYEYEIVSNERGKGVILDKIGLQQQAFSTGVSGGLNFNFSNFCVYGLYGAEWLSIQTSQKLVSDTTQYSLIGKDINYPDFIFSLSMGLDYRIPKTSVGIGVRYNIKNITTKPEDNFIEIKNSASTNTKYTYYVNKIVDTKYKFNDFGVRFIWDFE